MSSYEDILAKVYRTASRIKVFPLPSTVLFPGVAMPLHMFEPRYRELARDAADTDGVFALASHPRPGESSAGRNPVLAPIACAGVMSMHEELADGRHNVVLTGVVRVRLQREHEVGRLYREFAVEVLPDGAYDGPDEQPLRQAVFELASRVPPELGRKMLRLVGSASGGRLADLVISMVTDELDRRRDLLNEFDIGRRQRAALADVSTAIAHLSGRKTAPMPN